MTFSTVKQIAKKRNLHIYYKTFKNTDYNTISLHHIPRRLRTSDTSVSFARAPVCAQTAAATPAA